VFSELAVNVLEDNGVVIGAALLKNICKHIVITQLSELDKLRRSKYIQSRISDVYTVAKRYLEDEKQVMFCGCPCQVAGLKMFLGKDYKNLLAVDILCHGVPSPLLFDEHIRYLEELSGKRVNEYEFRLKENLQTPYYNCYVKYNEKETFKTCFEDVYFKLFLKEKTYRECCYKCEYASFDRVGDLSIGDYGWARNFHNELKDFDKSGLNISAILVNNEKGQNAIENLEEKVVLIESDINYLATRNKAINAPAKRPDIRDKIYKEINIQGYSAWADKYKKSKEYTEYRKIKLKYFLKRIMSN
jgi:coenzyme F420-reducing hydrogenase beta subunit